MVENVIAEYENPQRRFRISIIKTIDENTQVVTTSLLCANGSQTKNGQDASIDDMRIIFKVLNKMTGELDGVLVQEA